MHRTGLFLFFAITLLAFNGGAWAEEPAKEVDPRAVFAETDKNNDGQVDHEEFYERVVDAFFQADTNKDGFLSPDEYGRLPLSRTFKSGDLNSDGRISLPEFVRDRFGQFEGADTNHDGELSLDEVVVTYEERKKP